MRQHIYPLRQDESGTAMVEYGLLVGVLALAVAAGATVLGGDISTMFNDIGTFLANFPIPA